MKELTGKQETEITVLRDRIFVVLDFLIRKDGDHFLVELREDIQYAFEIKNLKGLRQVYSETNSIVKSLSINDRSELEELLIGTKGRAFLQRNILKIETVLKRASILDDDEYRIVHDYVQDICEDDKFAHKIKDLESIVSKYDKLQE